jgi:hypothetical protein
MTAEFPLAFAPVPAIPAGTEMASPARGIDPVPHRLLHHRVKRLRIPAFFRSDFAALLHQFDRFGLRDGVQSAGAAGAFGRGSVSSFNKDAADAMVKALLV